MERIELLHSTPLQGFRRWSRQREMCNVAARRSHSQQPGPGRVDPARQRGDRMAPLGWGVRGSDGAASGDDGREQVGDAVSTPHHEEDFTLTPQKRPGPGLHSDTQPTTLSAVPAMV